MNSLRVLKIMRMHKTRFVRIEGSDESPSRRAVSPIKRFSRWLLAVYVSNWWLL